MSPVRFPLPVLLLVVSLFAVACGAVDDGPSVGAPSTSTATGAEPAGEPAADPTAVVRSVVVLGDSIMVWNAESSESIPDVIGAALGVSVVNAAESGAFAGDVPGQYAETSGTADWVVFDGGGNDLNDRCGCGACAAVADSILSADGTSGVIADFTEELVAGGKNVAVVGYYELPSDAAFGFAECNDELELLKPRWQRLADRFESVISVDPSQVVTGSDREAFDDDNVHPSPVGSRIVGEQIAAAISAAG